MDTTIETLSSISRKMRFAVASADIKKGVDKKLKDYAKTAKIAGFRPGKAPLSIIEKQYGYSAYMDSMNDAVADKFDADVRAQKLRVAGMPKIEADNDASSEEVAAFTATFDIYPEIAFPALSGVEVEKFDCAVTDEDVNETLTMLRKQRATYSESAGAAASGDRLTCDFEGKIDGVAFDGGTAKDFVFELGQGRMLPEFETAALGLKVGESKTFDLKFPDDYQGEAVKGKTAQFTLTAKKLEAAQLPELNDEFAKTMAVVGGTLDALKADVRKNIEREVGGRMAMRTKTAAFDALVKSAQFDVPAALIADEAQASAERFKQQMKERGMDAKQMPNIPVEMFNEEAERRVRLGLAIGELIAQQKLEAKPDQVKAKIAEFAASYQSPEEVEAWYFADRKRLADVEAIVLEDNALQYVLSNAKVKTTSISFKDVMAQQ